MKSVVQELSVDLWICNYYRVLPTDERFKRLTDRQKDLLIVSFLEQPSAEDLHFSYGKRKEREREFSINYDNLRKRGYTEEQIRRIRSQIDEAKKAL